MLLVQLCILFIPKTRKSSIRKLSSFNMQQDKMSTPYLNLLICILGVVFLLSLLFHCSGCFAIAVGSNFMLL